MDVKVVFKDLPCTVRGFAVCCCDEGQDYFTIFINAHMSAEMQSKTYDHEMSHIGSGDFHAPDVEVVESMRHAQEVL